MQHKMTASAISIMIAALLVVVSAGPASAAAPQLVVLTPADGSAAADATPTFSGTSDCTIGSCSDITVDVYSRATGAVVESLTAAKAASWSVTSAGLTDGNYTVTATQARPGKSGGTTTTTPIAFMIDTTGPVVTLSAAATVDEGSSAAVSYTIDDGDGIGRIAAVDVTCGSVSPTNAANSDTAGSFDCAYLDGPASETITAAATDALGNVGPTSSLGIDVRNVAPVAAATSGPSSVEEGATGNYSFSFSDVGADTIATVDASCGSGTLSALTFDNSGASFDCTFATAGATSVSAAATDSDGAVGAPATVAVDVTVRPDSEPTPEPTTDPTPEPATEPTPEPTTEPTPEPTTESTPEPATEPTPEPSPAPAPAFPAGDEDVPAQPDFGTVFWWDPPPGTVTADTPAISPNGDGRRDEVTVDADFDQPMTWTFVVTRDGTTVTTVVGHGASFSHAWDGSVDGEVVPDGTYTWQVFAAGANVVMRPVTGEVVVDKGAPEIVDVVIAKGRRTVASINVLVGEDSSVKAKIRRGKRVLTTLTADARGGERSSLLWRGRDASGRKVREGKYRIRVVAIDRAGNRTSFPGRTIALR